MLRSPVPRKISLYSYKRLLSLYLISGLVNAEICLYLVGWRMFKTQNNSDLDLPRIHDVTTSKFQQHTFQVLVTEFRNHMDKF